MHNILALDISSTAIGWCYLQPDVRAAAAQLADLPTLLRTAEPADARAILAEVLDVVYLMPHAAMAVRPTTKLAQEWRELRLKCHLWWAGWAPAGLRHYS